jgi:hypothetical protein
MMTEQDAVVQRRKSQDYASATKLSPLLTHRLLVPAALLCLLAARPARAIVFQTAAEQAAGL